MTPLRALVVDDSQAMRKSIVYALQRLPGISCDEACDGVEALKKFGLARYDVVLTDINMPLMDGLKLVSHLRREPSNAKLPIVVITTESAAADRQRALNLGASAYLVKPVQAKVVQDTVKDLLKLA
jgi:two-component system, chemotaxis family, chemotaxis protein CheY